MDGEGLTGPNPAAPHADHRQQDTSASTLPADRRHPAASALHRFLGTPEAMRLLSSPGSGVPASTFRPPVHVTIWS